MKNKIILIQPLAGYADRMSFPLSCLALAATLRKENFQPIIIDANLYDDYLARIQNHLPDALFAGISVISDPPQIKNGLEISECIHRINPNIPVVWGGWYPTCSPTEASAHKNVDIIVLGEGDITAISLAKALQNNMPLSYIKGIGYKTGGKASFTPHSDFVTDLDSLPYTPWDLIDFGTILKKYQKKVLQVQTGRGCLMQCTFCAHKVLYPKKNHRMFSASYIFNNIEPMIKKYNIRNVIFYEGTCLNSKARTQELCQEILHRRLDIHWEASGRANVFPYLGADTYEMLVESGCRKINFGFESGSQRILNRIRKKHKIKEMLRTALAARRYSLQIECYFIYDFPFEKIIDKIKTMVLLCFIKIILPRSLIYAGRYRSYPGTELYEEYKSIDKTRAFHKTLKISAWKKIFTRIHELVDFVYRIFIYIIHRCNPDVNNDSRYN